MKRIPFSALLFFIYQRCQNVILCTVLSLLFFQTFISRVENTNTIGVMHILKKNWLSTQQPPKKLPLKKFKGINSEERGKKRMIGIIKRGYFSLPMKINGRDLNSIKHLHLQFQCRNKSFER